MHIELIGILAGICTTIAFLPQVIQVWRTNCTDGISRPMYIIFCTGVFLWFAYGALIGSYPMIIANFITFVLAGLVLIKIFRKN